MAKTNLFLKFIPQYFDFLVGFRPQEQDAFLQTLQWFSRSDELSGPM